MTDYPKRTNVEYQPFSTSYFRKHYERSLPPCEQGLPIYDSDNTQICALAVWAAVDRTNRSICYPYCGAPICHYVHPTCPFLRFIDQYQSKSLQFSLGCPKRSEVSPIFKPMISRWRTRLFGILRQSSMEVQMGHHTESQRSIMNVHQSSVSLYSMDLIM